jgi:hypothetical protein
MTPGRRLMFDLIDAVSLLAIVLLSVWLVFGDGVNVLYYRVLLNHHPDTLRIRCEVEQRGILIGDSCFKRDAVIWSEKEAPR